MLLLIPLSGYYYFKFRLMRNKNKIMACPLVPKKFKRRKRRRSKSAPNMPIKNVEVINPLFKSHSDSEVNDTKL